jgi:hypothetical protein
MARLAPKIDVIRALFARSGNQCAFPRYVQALVNQKINSLVKYAISKQLCPEEKDIMRIKQMGH